MGQSASAPMRSPPRGQSQNFPPPPPHTPEAPVPGLPDQLRDATAGAGVASDDEPSSRSGVQGIRRRRSTAGGPREYKRQRPHQDEDSVSPSVSSVSSSYGSFETARSRTSADSADSEHAAEAAHPVPSAADGSNSSTRSARSTSNPLRRLTNQVRSVFAGRSTTPSAELEPARSVPAGFVNTAVPGTPGLLEDAQVPPYEPYSGASFRPRGPFDSATPTPPLPLQMPAMSAPVSPAPAYTRRNSNDTTSENLRSDSDRDRDAAEHEHEHEHEHDHPREGPDGPGVHHRRADQIARDETTQVEMLSRVLLAAASLTALRLVGSHFGRGELYGGSNEAAAMRRRAQAEIEARRSQREREERNSDGSGAGASDDARADDSARAITDGTDRNDTHPHDGTSAASATLPQEFTFAAFLEQLRTGRHSAELSNAMFGSAESNFFRLFRFQEDVEGRIPILLMGIRAAERGPGSGADGEHADDAWVVPRRRSSVSDQPLHGGRRHGTPQHGLHDLGFDFDDHPEIDDEDAFLQPENPSPLERGIREDSDEQEDSGDEGSYIYERTQDFAHHDPIFDDDDDDDEHDDHEDNPFRPDHHHPDESRRLLNSLISGLSGMDPHQDPDIADDPWLRPRHRHPSVPHAEPGHRERMPPRSQQSWVIYVIGGAYPRTHPIFFAPSLMTDNPTYEDLLIVEELLGPVKPPVATRTDLDSAGGTFAIHKNSELLEDRCPVCLMDYQEKDMCRTLNCKHTFHQECVDSWLTRSHNTCPMCRTTGVPSSGPGRHGRPGFAAA